MSIEALLDLIRHRFTPSEGQIILRGLTQDPLVWQFVQDETKSLTYFKAAPEKLEAYSPAAISQWLIEENFQLSIGDLKAYQNALPVGLRKSAAQAFETILSTNLPPSDLLTAGLLALTLRERRIIEDSWQGMAGEIFHRGDQKAIRKAFEIWRSAFAILYGFSNDYKSLMKECFLTNVVLARKISAPLYVHTLLSNPLDASVIMDELFDFAQHLTVDYQLDCLNELKNNHAADECKNLSQHLMQTKANTNLFARVFSELELFDNANSKADPLGKKIRLGLVEDINRLAAFYHFSGEAQKAADTYQKSNAVLDFLKSQTLYQAISCDPLSQSHSAWLQIIKSIPNSKNARLSFVNLLINGENYKEAEKYLEELPDSPEKRFLVFKIDSAKGKSDIGRLDVKEILKSERQEPAINRPSYFVHPPNINFQNELLEETIKQSLDQGDLYWVDKLLNNALNDKQTIILLRNYLESNGQIDRAIELTSYLERVEPEDILHREDLARVYSKAERWEDAFVTLQEIIKTKQSPRAEVLEMFAESALNTGRTDTAISICQNILKSSPQNQKALIFLGKGYTQKGDVVKAIQHMEQVVELIPENAETWLTLAQIWQENGQTDRAFEILNQGSLALPNEPTLLRALGKAHLEKQAPADALTYLSKAHEIEPSHLEGRLNLAQAKYELGLFEQAKLLLEDEMKNYRNNPELARLLGRVLYASGKVDDAEPLIIFAAKHFPEDLETVSLASDLVLNKAETSIDEVNHEKLIKIQNILEDSQTRFSDNLQIMLNLADIDRLLGEHEKALEAYSNLSEKDFSNRVDLKWRLTYGIGKAALASENSDLALAALQEANAIKPGNLMILHGLAEAYQANDLLEKAQTMSKTALKLANQDTNNILWYANFKIQNNEPEEAVKVLREAVEINPLRPEIKIWLAKTLLSLGNSNEAEEVIQDLIIHSQANSDDLQKAAYLSLQINNTELALRALEKAVHILDDDNLVLTMDLIKCYSLSGQPQKALAFLEDHEKLTLNHPEMLILKSDILEDLGQYDQSYKVLKSIENVYDSDECITWDEDVYQHSPLLYTSDLSPVYYFYRLGNLSRYFGDFTASEHYFSKTQLLAPEDKSVLNAAVENLMSKLDFDGALKLASRLDEMDVTHLDADALAVKLNQQQMLLFSDEIHKSNIDDQYLNQLSAGLSARYHAVQSQIAYKQNKFDAAADFLIQAIQNFNEDNNIEHRKLEGLFQQTLTSMMIGEAALMLEDYKAAVSHHRIASVSIDSQPLYHWRRCLAIIRSAEAQQKAQALSIINHAPGQTALSDQNRNEAMLLTEQLERFLSKDQHLCLKARLIAAFTGSWPLSLNADVCLANPNEAAAVLLSTDNNQLAQDILETYPDEILVLQAYAIYALKNNKKGAIRVIEKALELDTSNPVSHALLGILEEKDIERKIRSLETALKFWADETGWHSLLADLYNKSGNIEAAANHITMALSATPDNPDFWQKSGEIKIKLNHLEEAKDDLAKSASLNQKNPEIFMRMAAVNHRLGHKKEAINNIRTAIELDPRNTSIASKEVELLLEQNDYLGAEEKARILLENNQHDTQLRIFLARAQAKSGKLDAALKTLKSDTKQGQKNTMLVLETIKIRKDKEGIETLLPDLVHLAESNPEDPGVLTTLTDWLIQTNRLKEAEETAQTILRILPENADVQLMLGRLQRKNGQLDQAISHLSNAINEDPYLIDAYIELGKTYQERRDFEKAIKVFQQGSQVNPGDASLYYHTGMALKECKNFRDAETMLKEAKKYAPDDPNIIRQLGVITALNLIHHLRERR
jgi:tetratricopeptide (TPR) repeat protein